MTSAQIRHLSDLATRAAAALIPIAADGIGADSHGGRLPDPAATLARALVALEEAGALAAQIRENAMGSKE